MGTCFLQEKGDTLQPLEQTALLPSLPPSSPFPPPSSSPRDADPNAGTPPKATLQDAKTLSARGEKAEGQHPSAPGLRQPIHNSALLQTLASAALSG